MEHVSVNWSGVVEIGGLGSEMGGDEIEDLVDGWGLEVEEEGMVGEVERQQLIMTERII